MASIQTEGSMVVRETRTYDFDGDFTFAYRDFPESPEWEYSDITILEDGVALRTATPADLEPAKTPGTYYLRRGRRWRRGRGRGLDTPTAH